MHYFLLIYLFSTSSVFVTEFSTQKECNKARKTMIKEMQNNLDVQKITCEKGYILEQFDVE